MRNAEVEVIIKTACLLLLARHWSLKMRHTYATTSRWRQLSSGLRPSCIINSTAHHFIINYALFFSPDHAASPGTQPSCYCICRQLATNLGAEHTPTHHHPYPYINSHPYNESVIRQINRVCRRPRARPQTHICLLCCRPHTARTW
jgi:hypothetical protein